MDPEISKLARERLKKIRAKRPPPENPEISAARTNFEAFCKVIEIVPKDGASGRVPLRFNHIQALFNVERTGRDIVLKPRQIGFTTSELARDLWTFLTKDGARVVIVCQSVSDNAPAKLISGVLSIMIEALRRKGWGLKFKTEAWNEFVLDNGNTLRIVVAGASEDAAAKKGRAGTITRLHLTETAFYEYAKKTLNALMECVPGPETGSEIVSESTPNGAAGVFYENCKDAQAGKGIHKFHFYHWYQHLEYKLALAPGEVIVPEDEHELELSALGVTPEQLKWRRAKIVDKGLDDFNQEYPSDPETCFLVSGRGFFDAHAIQQNLKVCREPIETRQAGKIRIYKRPDKYDTRQRFLLSLDSSEGGGLDPSAGVLIDCATAEHYATIDGQYTPYQFAEVGATLAREYNNALIVVERNNHGHAVLQALESPPRDMSRAVMYENVYSGPDEKPGWHTTPVTRPQLLDDFEDAHRKGYWQCPDISIITQMRTFIVHNNKPQAAAGQHDDLVIAAAIAWKTRMSGTMNIMPTRELPHGSRFGGKRGFG